MTPHGRDRRADFADLFSKTFRAKIVMSPAFSDLTSAAKSVCFLVYVKIDNARFHKRRQPDGRPIFTFTAVDAKKLLNISGVTHTAAIRQLVEHGFIDRVECGGLIGANGIASTFSPSRRWEKWLPACVKHPTANIEKARKAKRSKKPESDQAPAKRAFAVSAQQLRPGDSIYYYRDDTRKRALGGTLLTELSDGWRIQAKRTQSKFRAPIIEIPHDRILTPDQLKVAQRKKTRSRQIEKTQEGIILNRTAMQAPFATTV